MRLVSDEGSDGWRVWVRTGQCSGAFLRPVCECQLSFDRAMFTAPAYSGMLDGRRVATACAFAVSRAAVAGVGHAGGRCTAATAMSASPERSPERAGAESKEVAEGEELSAGGDDAHSLRAAG